MPQNSSHFFKQVQDKLSHFRIFKKSLDSDFIGETINIRKRYLKVRIANVVTFMGCSLNLNQLKFNKFEIDD